MLISFNRQNDSILYRFRIAAFDKFLHFDNNNKKTQQLDAIIEK